LAGAEAMAAPMTEAVFVSFFSQPRSGGFAGPSFTLHFVHWNDKNPVWNVKNIGWVEKYGGKAEFAGTPVMVWDPEANHGRGAWVDETRYAPWKRVNIPEPSTALLVGGAMGIAALRRRSI